MSRSVGLQQVNDYISNLRLQEQDVLQMLMLPERKPGDRTVLIRLLARICEEISRLTVLKQEVHTSGCFQIACSELTNPTVAVSCSGPGCRSVFFLTASWLRTHRELDCRSCGARHTLTSVEMMMLKQSLEEAN